MTTTHILEVDGYNVAERLLEGVMFQVHIEESPDDLRVTDVTTKPEDAAYLAGINVALWSGHIREHVEANINHTKKVAREQGLTVNEWLDQCQVEYQGYMEPGETFARIDVLEEV